MKTKSIALALLSTILLINSINVISLANSTPTGIAALWHFDEGIDSAAADSSGNSNTGTLSGGKFGNALYFDGISDYVEIPHSSSLSIFSTGITLEAWINAEEIPASGLRDLIVSKTHAYALQVSDGGKVRVYLGALSPYHQTASIVVSTNTRHHVATSWDESHVRARGDEFVFLTT